MMAAVRFVLASASPRRRELVAAAGLACDVHAVDADERRLANEAPDAYVERLARLKASLGLAAHPDRVVVGADTAVVVDEEILGKPADAIDAARMLRVLSGRPHVVMTGVAVAHAGGLASAVERTTVWFAPLSDAAIRWYVASGEPFDKAGAYAIQGLASRFIPRIEGSYANVVGLPIAALVRLLDGVAGTAGGPADLIVPPAAPYSEA
jgi:septum formation protein